MVKQTETISPFLELVNISEKRKKVKANKLIKNMNMNKDCLGSTK